MTCLRTLGDAMKYSKMRTTVAVCLCLGALVPLACGTRMEADGSGGAASDGESGGTSSGGADSNGGESSGGAAVGGSGVGGAFGGADTGGSSMGGGAGLGGGSCSEDIGGEEFCTASAEKDERCGEGDFETAYDSCMTDDAMFDRFDACLVHAMIDCTATPCQPTSCAYHAMIDLNHDLFNEEVVFLCEEEPSRTDVDCSTENQLEGAQEDCHERAVECSVMDDNCLHANLVREEFLPERDACLEAPCDELVQCLHDVAHGPSP